MSKEVVITGAKVRRELWILFACFMVAVGINIGTIIYYARPWTEIYQMIGYEVIIGFVLYVAQWVVRLIVMFIKLIFKH